MLYNDYYEIELLVNGQSIQLSPLQFSFSMEDSIHSLYNWAHFNIHDTTGLIQESLFTAKGNKVSLGFGIRDAINKCEFSIDTDKTTEPSQKGLLSGDVDIDLVNSWFDNQEIKSTAYRNTISNIVQQLISPKFKNFSIEQTGCDDIWYQPLITDAKLITDILLPCAYSNGASESPFFAYISNNGIFNFKSLNSLYKENPVATLKYIAEAKEKTFTINSIMKIRRWRESNKNTRKYFHRNLYSINSTDNSIVKENDFIFSYPAGIAGNVPIVGNKNLSTDFVNFGYAKTAVGQKQSILGRKINSTKESIFIDRFLIATPLNPQLIAGKKILLKIFTVDTSSGDNQKPSTTFSGEYIIEQSKHIWNGERREGFTTIVVGRKHINLSSAYFVKNIFIQ